MQASLEAAFDASLAAWRKCRPQETTPLDEDIEPVSLSNRNETQIIGVAHDHISTLCPILQAAGWQVRQTAEDPASGAPVVILVRNQAGREPECDGGLLFHLIGEFARQAAWSFDPQEAALPKITNDDHAEAFLYRFGTIGGIRGAGPASLVDLLCMLLWSQVQPPMPKLSDEVLKATPNAAGALVSDVMAGLPVETAVAMASTVCWLDHRRLSNRSNVKTPVHPAHLSRAPMASARPHPPKRFFLETQVTTTLFEALVASRQYAAASRLLAIVGRVALPASGSSGGCAIRFKGPNRRRGEEKTSVQEMSALHLIALFPPRSDAEHHELQLLLNTYVESEDIATLLSPQLTKFASVTSCSNWNQLPETEHCVAPIALLLRYSRASSTEDGLSAIAAFARCGNPLALADGPHQIHTKTVPRWPTTAVCTQHARLVEPHPVFPWASLQNKVPSRASVGSIWSMPGAMLSVLDFRGKLGVTPIGSSTLLGEAVVGSYLPIPLSSAAKTRMAAFVGYPSQFAAAAIVQGPVADVDINTLGSMAGSNLQEATTASRPEGQDDHWVEAAEYCECMPGRLQRGSLVDQLIQLAAHHACRTVLDPKQWRIEVDANTLKKRHQRVAEALTDDTDDTETETDIDTDPDHEDEVTSQHIRYINLQDGSIHNVHPVHGMFVEMVRHRRFPREWIEQCCDFSEISSPQDSFNDCGKSLWDNSVFSKRQIVPAVDIHTGLPALQRGYSLTRTVSTGAPLEEVHTPRTLTDVAVLIVQAIKLREWIAIGFGLVPLEPRVLNQDIADVILSFVAEVKNADELALMMRVWGAMADGTKIRVIDTTHPAMDLYTEDGERAPRYPALPAELPLPLSDEELEQLAQPYIKKGAKPLATKPPVSRVGIKENLSGRRAIGAAKPQPWLLSGRAHDEDELGSSDVEDPF